MTTISKSYDVAKFTENPIPINKLQELSKISLEYQTNIAKFLKTRSKKKIHNFKKHYKWWDEFYIYKILKRIVPTHRTEIDAIINIDDGIYNDITYKEIRSKLKPVIEHLSSEDWELFNSYLSWFEINKLIYGVEVDEGCESQYKSIHTAIELSKLPNKAEWLDHVSKEISGWWD